MQTAQGRPLPQGRQALRLRVRHQTGKGLPPRVLLPRVPPPRVLPPPHQTREVPPRSLAAGLRQVPRVRAPALRRQRRRRHLLPRARQPLRVPPSLRRAG